MKVGDKLYCIKDIIPNTESRLQTDYISFTKNEIYEISDYSESLNDFYILSTKDDDSGLWFGLNNGGFVFPHARILSDYFITMEELRTKKLDSL